MSLHPALERLAQNIFCQPYASNGKIRGVFQPARKMAKSQALKKPIIQINGPRRICYLSFDVDLEGGGAAWLDANLPQPTFTVINPKNTHAHLIWEIEPIWLSKKDDNRSGYLEAPPVRYMKAVSKAMRRDLRADNAFNGTLVKNPFHASWWVICGPAKAYRLSELAMHLELTDSEAEFRDNSEGRNCTLFDSIRYWGYRNRDDYSNWFRFKDELDHELDRLNQQLSVPLSFREVTGIGKSVGNWIWDHYTGSGRWVRHRGVMGLDPSEPIRFRQQKGQAYTSQVRRDTTISKISGAIGSLTREGKRVSKAAVAVLTGLHRNTVARYWSVTSETASLRDNHTPSLRSVTASPRQSDTLITTQLSTPKPPTYPELLIQYQGNIVRAASWAQRYANQGILIDDLPTTFKMPLQSVVDKVRTERSMNCIDQRTLE